MIKNYFLLNKHKVPMLTFKHKQNFFFVPFVIKEWRYLHRTFMLALILMGNVRISPDCCIYKWFCNAKLNFWNELQNLNQRTEIRKPLHLLVLSLILVLLKCSLSGWVLAPGFHFVLFDIICIILILKGC